MSALRILGIAVFGGLAISQLLTLYSTPVIYLALQRLVKQRVSAATHLPVEVPVPLA